MSCVLLRSRIQEIRRIKAAKRIEIKMERDRGSTYLLTEDQLVIKEEEDSLLAASVRLVDP